MTIDTLCESTKLRLIANALGLQQCTKTAAAIIPLPGTDNVVAIGPRDWIAKNVGAVPAAVPATVQPSTLEIETIARLMRENTNRHLGLLCEPFARAVEREVRTRLAATTQASTAQAELPAILFDGKAVYDEVMAGAKCRTRTSAENVADTLDAVVRLMRRVTTSSPDATPTDAEAQAEEAKLYRDLTGDAMALGFDGIVAALEALRNRQAAAEVRDAALEEAAQVCDAKRKARVASRHPREASTARALTEEIRALRSAGDTGGQS